MFFCLLVLGVWEVGAKESDKKSSEKWIFCRFLPYFIWICALTLHKSTGKILLIYL